jgi:hypothetical protein
METAVEPIALRQESARRCKTCRKKVLEMNNFDEGTYQKVHSTGRSHCIRYTREYRVPNDLQLFAGEGGRDIPRVGLRTNKLYVCRYESSSPQTLVSTFWKVIVADLL